MESTTLVDDEGITRVKVVGVIDGAENDVVIYAFDRSYTRIETTRTAGLDVA